MLKGEGSDWLEEENRFLRAKIKQLERIQHPNAGAENVIRSGFCPDCARTAVTLRTLRESERRLRTVFEASPDGIILIDDQMRVVEANPGAEKIFGLPRRELIGRPATDLFDTRFARELTWACSAEARDYSGEDSIHRPDGTVCEIEVFGRATERDRHLFFLHEITELKRTGGDLAPVVPFCESREAVR